MPERHWREGLHQAVEAKEGVPITMAADHAPKVNFQAYFKLVQEADGERHGGAELCRSAGSQALGGAGADPKQTVVRQHSPTRVARTRRRSATAVVEEIQRCRWPAGRA